MNANSSAGLAGSLAIDTNGLEQLKTQAKNAPDKAIAGAAKQFESMFVSQMLSPMFAGLSTDGLGGGGSGEAAFRPMLIEKYAEALTTKGGFGISAAVLKEILHMQGIE